ncbi:MAG TPA: GNAT family N-acetyltransferase [Methanocella sp.]|jgi:phosphinothricin acetyltransferase
MSALTIRDAVESDLSAIVEIYNSTIPGHMVTADTEPVTVESRLPWFREHRPGFRPLWVAEIDGRIVAWLSFSSFYGRPAYNATAEISIYVAPEYRLNGIGRELLQRSIDHAPSIGIRTLLGFIFAHNEPSLRLFRRYGFEEWAHLPDVAELDGIERSLLILGKRVK